MESDENVNVGEDIEAEDCVLVCDECSVGGLSKKQLRIHKYNAHCKSKRESICPECGYVVIGGAMVFRNHMRKHEIKEQCPSCSKSFLRKSMPRHLKNCKPAPNSDAADAKHVCEQCGKQLSSKRNLANHLKTQKLVWRLDITVVIMSSQATGRQPH